MVPDRTTLEPGVPVVVLAHLLLALTLAAILESITLTNELASVPLI
jgi:hypothetical protein